MKRITFLMTGLLVLMLACDNPVNVPENAPDVFRELTNLDLRVNENDINVHVTMSFKFPFIITNNDGDMEYVLQTIESGPANFPGNEKNAGTCDMGTWINKNGKRTSGSMDKPHPHCVEYVLVGGETQETVYVELEPISAHYDRQGGGTSNQWNLRFTKKSVDDEALVNLNFNSGNIKGEGAIEAWAVLHGETSRRVGKITIELDQFINKIPENEDGVCTVLGTGAPDGYDECINQLVAFSYVPLPADEGGIGEAMSFPNDDSLTTGFLWWHEMIEIRFRND